eukprot:CAMPEP_0183348504 /NCGR_PEP_ID=MMETSP0164_2-20130417/12996_1 /TAXON_ID=221442 /ORGANISM="Coccolithus pelagicus ssp braarudi, Strain PLY182g" /LENGTH=243 /DNA_ID=CAMNT_0025520113 /DNA_START=838 /DNA_END=1566 /DNA_ORIENTATION=-
MIVELHCTNGRRIRNSGSDNNKPLTELTARPAPTLASVFPCIKAELAPAGRLLFRAVLADALARLCNRLEGNNRDARILRWGEHWVGEGANVEPHRGHARGKLKHDGISRRKWIRRRARSARWSSWLNVWETCALVREAEFVALGEVESASTKQAKKQGSLYLRDNLLSPGEKGEGREGGISGEAMRKETPCIGAAIASTAKPITLVAAAALISISPDGLPRVLLAQRPAGKSLSGLWEFPGG